MSMMRMLNATREGLTLDYQGKGLLRFVSNERGGNLNNSPGRCLLTNLKSTSTKPVRKGCSFIPPQTENFHLWLNKTGKGKNACKSKMI